MTEKSLVDTSVAAASNRTMYTPFANVPASHWTSFCPADSNPIDQGRDGLTQDVVYSKDNVAFGWQLVSNERCGVEWIRIDLPKGVRLGNYPIDRNDTGCRVDGDGSFHTYRGVRLADVVVHPDLGEHNCTATKAHGEATG